MEKSKKSLRVLWIAFGLIFLIKAVIVFFRNGPFIFPDEGCIIQRAMHFASTFRIESCANILDAPLGDAYPLYSILIAPVYIFFHGLLAYKVVLILNSLIVASLIFPLYKIFKTFVKTSKYCLVAAVITIFLPQFTVFEKTLMTETLYSALLIWSLLFYIRSLIISKSAGINKTIAVLFAILTSLTRPFGFILLIAITLNELIISKRKKAAVFLYLPISIFLTSLAIFFLSKGVFGGLLIELNALTEAASWKYLIVSISEQMNSFTVATFFLPLAIFLICFLKNDFKKFGKIKYPIIIYIILNFIISARHIFGYLISINYSPNLITRYINSSVILIFISAVIFIHRYKKFSLTLGNSVLVLILIIPILLHDASKFGLSLNLEMIPFLDLNATKLDKDLIPTSEIYQKLLLPVIFLLFLTLLLKNKKILISTGVIMVIFSSILSYVTIQNYSRPSKLVDSLEEIKRSTVAVIVPIGDDNALGEFWRLKSISKHFVKLFILESKIDTIGDPVLNDSTLKEADYIISSLNINLPLYGYTSDGLLVFVNKK